MKKRLICQISPLSRPVSQRTLRRKQLIAGSKKGPHELYNQSYEPFIANAHDVSVLSSSKSPGKKADDFSTGLVSSKKKDCDKDRNHDDNPQGIDEIYFRPVVIKRKKSPSLKSIAAASRSPRIQKGRNSMPLLSPGKRLLSRSMHGLDKIHGRRTVSMTTVDMKKLEEAINSQIYRKKVKNGKLNDNTLPDGSDTSFIANECDVSGLSSSKSSEMKADDYLADSPKTKEHDENPPEIDEIYLKTAMLKSKRSLSCKTVSRSPRIQKRRNSMPSVSPGKRLLSKCMHGLHKVHRRRTVCMTTVDMKKLEEAIESRIRKKKKNQKLDDDTLLNVPDMLITSYDHGVCPLSSSMSSGLTADDSLADSSKAKEQDENPLEIDETYLKPAMLKRKRSLSCKTESRSTRIQKRRNSMPSVSSGKRLLPRCMHGLDEVHRHRTVHMTMVDMTKPEESIDSQIRKKKKNGKFDVDPFPEGPDTSITAKDNDVALLSSSKSSRMKANAVLSDCLKSPGKGDVLQRIDETCLKTEVTKGKKSCKTIPEASRSPRIQKGRNSMPFLSPKKRSMSRSMHGLDRVHRHHTVSMTTVEMNKLKEFIDLSQKRNKEKKEEVHDETQRDGPDASLLASDPDVSGSSSSPGVEADVFLASLEWNKTQYSSQSLEHNEDLQRSNDSFHKHKVTKKKDSSSWKKICATSRSPRIQKQGKSIPFLSPGKQLLSKSMRGLDKIHRCHSLSLRKQERKKLQEAIDLSQIRKKMKSEKPKQNPLHTFKSPSKKVTEIVETLADKMRQSEKLSCLKRQHSIQESELTMDDEVAPNQNKKEETFVHASSIEVHVKSGKTPDLDFEKLDEMYSRRFNPNQECTRADLDFKKLDEKYKRRLNPSLECTQTSVNMDTVTRILSFQEHNDSRKAIPPIIQRCAFAGDIINPESEVSDSTVEEANETLLEKEVRCFFEDNEGHCPSDFREDALALNVTPGCIQQETENRLSESELVISAEQEMQSPTVPGHDNIMVIDEHTHYRTPDSLRFMEDMLKLEENTFHSIPDSPRDIEDLQKVNEDTKHGIPDSHRDNEDLQKPRNIQDQHKLAENTCYNIPNSHRNAGDLQKLGKTEDLLAENTDLIVIDRPNDIGNMQKPSGNVNPAISNSPRDIEDLQKSLAENTNPIISKSPRNTKDLQKIAENTNPIISNSQRSTEDLQKLAENTNPIISNSQRNTEDLQKLARNTPKFCSQGNRDACSEAVFARDENEQIVPKEVDKQQTLSQKLGSLTHQDHTMAATRNDCSELMPIDVDMDGLWDDMCTPFQHSTPANHTNHPKSNGISPDDLLTAWAEIEQEKKTFVIYCHEDTAPSIIKALENCPDITDSKSLSLRYLNNGSSVEVQGMVLKDGHFTRPKKSIKDGEKKKKKIKEKTVLTITGAAAKNKAVDSAKRKKKSAAKKETKTKRKTKTETKKEPQRKTKRELKTERKEEMKIEAMKDVKKEVIKETMEKMKKKTKKGKKKGMKKDMENSTGKETKKKAEKEIKKLEKKKTKSNKKKKVKGEMEKETTREAKKETKMKAENETRKGTKKGLEKETKEKEKEVFSKKIKETKMGTVKKEIKKKIKKAPKKKSKKEKMKVTKSREVNTGRLKIISGPITGAARKKNETRWERELKEQPETAWSKVTVQPSMESDLGMMRCLRKMAWTSLKQPAKDHINQDRDQGFEDDDSDLGTFVDFLSFPDVFMTEKKDRPSFRKVPPSEIQILKGS